MQDKNNNRIAEIVNEKGLSHFFLICEHASNVIPEKYNNLGLSDNDLQRHIAWDIGAEQLARQLSAILDAPLVLQTRSRLLYDCNRPPSAAGSIPELSESTLIPGNTHLSTEQKSARADEIYYPFHQQIAELLDQRSDTIIVTIHSFTPSYNNQIRSVDIGIINDTDDEWASALANSGQKLADIEVTLNEPYSRSDGVTHTLALHGTARGLANVMIEVKNTLIEKPAGQQKFARILATMLKENLST